MYISQYNNGATIPSGFVNLRITEQALQYDEMTLFKYFSIINCLNKFDFNYPIFLTVQFILLFLNNTINQHEKKILKYIHSIFKKMFSTQFQQYFQISFGSQLIQKSK
ncbi:unnamed protein product [Paramecium sonneborni]|uniref:Transmembrane protein n=1 Tax=Paramecium sonneborni TaxID=65129 RepID=A0A8S1NAE9_9CILI|nr:unnamed protein product [Paramecium sonneborni]